MLLAVDVPRRLVLLVVHLGLLSSRQLAAVRCAVRFHLLVDALLLILEFRRFSGGQLPALHALRDAVLLILAPLSDFVVSVLCCVGVVLVLVNVFGNLILLFVDLLFFRSRQLSAVRRAVRLGFAIDRCFLGFQLGRLARRQLPALDAVR